VGVERSMLATAQLWAIPQYASFSGTAEFAAKSDLQTMTILNRRALWNLVNAPTVHARGIARRHHLDGDLIETLQEMNSSCRTVDTHALAGLEGRSLLKARNVSHHYDLRNDYTNSLDEQLVYTCATRTPGTH
jgi:hypothetical protein